MKSGIFFFSLGQVIFFLGAYYFDVSFPPVVWMTYAIIGIGCLATILWLTLRETIPQTSSWKLNEIGAIQLSLVVVFILLLATFLRAKNLDVPMRVDEARTVVEFADAMHVQPFALFTHYGSNNNHPLNSLAIYITTGILSSSSPDVVRLPVFVVGILLVLLTYVVSKKLYQISEIAYLAAFYIAISPFAIRYSINARGYIYIATFFLILWWIAWEIIAEQTPMKWLLLVVFTVLGMFTNLTMLIPALSIYVWLFLNFVFRADKADLRNSISRLIFSGIMVGLASIVLYIPMIIHEGTRFFNNKWITSETLSVFLSDIPIDTVFAPITWGQHSYLIPVFIALTAIGIVIEIWKYRSIPIILVIALIISGLLLIQRPSWIADRFYTFIIPIVAIYFAIGLYHVCLKRRELMVLAGFVIISLTFLSSGNFSRERYSEPGYLDIEQAIRVLIQDYNLDETDTILAPMGHNYVVRYYLTQYDQSPQIAITEGKPAGSQRIFVLEGRYDPLNEILDLYFPDIEDENFTILELERFGINNLYEVQMD